MRKPKLFFALFLLCSICLPVQQLLSKNPTKKNTKPICNRRKWESVGTDFLYSFRHYSKFYGDPKTIHGGFLKRSYFLSNLGGFRDRLADRGVYLDASMSQFFAANYTGGQEQDFMRTNGSCEYWFIVDTGKVGLWPKGALMLHAKTTWDADESVTEDVGSIAAANVDPRTPVAGESTTALSEVAVGQVVSDLFSFRLGKLDATGPIDDNEFANSARHQFIYSGLVNNPIIFTFIPHTLLSFLPIWKTEKHKMVLLMADADGSADKSGFDTLFNGNAVFCFQYQFSPTIKQELPGNYRFIGSYSTKPVTNYAIDSRHVLGKEITDIVIPKKCENYAWFFNFDQYLWKRENGEGAGIFGRVGWAPPDRNVIDEFYSIGIGGHGMIFKNRPYDEWGVGYAATHISGQLRRDLEELDIAFDNFEHAFEAFYNIRVTPALHWTINAQVIRPPLKSRGTAFVISSRLRMDF